MLATIINTINVLMAPNATRKLCMVFTLIIKIIVKIAILAVLIDFMIFIDE